MLEAIWASLDSHTSTSKSNTLFSRIGGFGLDFLLDFSVVLRVFSIFLGDFRDVESSSEVIYLFDRFCGGVCGKSRASRLWDRLSVESSIEVIEAVINFVVWSGILFPYKTIWQNQNLTMMITQMITQKNNPTKKQFNVVSLAMQNLC